MAIYLDNAATSFPKPPRVYTAVQNALVQIGVAPGRGGYRRGIAAARLVFEAREALAQLFGVADSARVVFTHSATESLNLAVAGLLRPGDHVVCTTMEHNSLLRPLHRTTQAGIEITWIEGDRTGFVDSRKIGAALRPATRLVAISHCSNVSGIIQPVEEIGLLARKGGALFLVDAAQSAGSLPIDVVAMNIDLLAAPGHKGLYGIQGSGFLYVGVGVDLNPLMVGGTGGYSTGLEQPESMPERYESGTLNTPGIAALKAGVEFVRETGIDAIRAREQQLVGQLIDGLRGIPGATVYGPANIVERGSVVSLTIAGQDPAEIGFRLDRDFDISVRAGLHCAFSAHKTIGTFPGGTLRLSPGYFNTADEIESCLTALRSVVSS